MAASTTGRKKGSIAVFFTLTILIIFVIPQGVLWIGFLFSQKHHYSDKLYEKISSETRIIADVSAVPLKQGKAHEVQFYLDRLSDDPDVLSVLVLDIEESTVAHAMGAVEVEGVGFNPFYMPWINKLETPINYNGEKVGTVIVTYSGRSTNDEMFSLLLMPPMAQALVFLVIVYFIFSFVNKNIGAPIEILKDRMARVTSGDLTVDIPHVGNKEMREISDGLKFLIEGLSANVKSLMYVTDSISVAISEITDTFKKTIERIKSQSISTTQIASSMRLADESHGRIVDSAVKMKDSVNDNLASVLEIKSNEAEILKSMNNLHDTVDNSYSVVAEMSQTSKVMMDNASRVLSSVENTSASVEEITASVREVERSARESSQIADNVRQLAAQKGVVTVDKAITGMNKITERVTNAVEIVNKLEKRSKEIQKILTFIKDINEQTNLLSINASILAEQAGEYGKGFTVVAEQMRALSVRTGGYTKEISGIIRQIQTETGDVVAVIESGMSLVKDGSDTVYEVGETMSSILESAHTSANMTKMIELATEDQVVALRHIEGSVIDVNSMAMEMNKAMEEMQKSSGFLFERVSEVKEGSEVTIKGASEQAIGVKFITENLERSTEDISQIESAITIQKGQGQDIISGVESIKGEGEMIISDLEGLSQAIDHLMGDVDSLRKKMATFKVK